MSYLSDMIHAAVWGEKPPETPKWVKWLHRNLSDSHCDECLKLDECWFEKGKRPKWPHHQFCHCILKDMPYNDVLTKSRTDCPYSKFDPYLFDPGNVYGHGKSHMLESWGYSVDDSRYLKEELEKQGLQNYIDGDYQLGLLNKYGQRINIRVEIPNKAQGGTVSFITGWMVRPNGQLTLNTPYGGK